MRRQRALHERFLQRIGDALLCDVGRAQHIRFVLARFGRGALAFDAFGQCGLLDGIQQGDEQHECDRGAGQQADMIDRLPGFCGDVRFTLHQHAVDRRDIGAKPVHQLLAVLLDRVGITPVGHQGRSDRTQIGRIDGNDVVNGGGDFQVVEIVGVGT